MFRLQRSQADKLSVQPYLIRFLRRFMNLMLLLSVGLGSFAQADMAYIANSGSNNVSVIDSSTNSVVALIPVGNKPYGVAVNPSGTRVYVSNSGGNSVSVIDTSTNTVVATVAVGSSPKGVAINPAGTRVYVANFNSNSVSVIDTSTNSVINTFFVNIPNDSRVGGPSDIAINSTGTRVYVANFNSKSVSVIDTATNTAIATVAIGTGSYCIAINPAGTRVYVASSVAYDGGYINVIDTNTNKVIATVTLQSVLEGVAINPAGTRVYVANRNKQSISVIDTSTNTVVATVAVGSSPTGVAINPAGTHAYVANYGSNSVSVIDTNTNTVIATVAVGTKPISFGKLIANFSACAYTISPATKTHTANKEIGTITITPSAASCPTVIPTSDSEWLTITSIDNNIVNYQILANTATTARIGNLTAAGQKFTVTQAGVSQFTLTVNATGKGTTGGQGNYLAGALVTLTATPEANSLFTGWTPAPCAASFKMPANPLTCTANFSACAYTISPTTKTHTASTETGTITITPSTASCPAVIPTSDS